jgi:hypothetical protein
VNYISSGALTHSVYNMDLSLKAIWEVGSTKYEVRSTKYEVRESNT